MSALASRRGLSRTKTVVATAAPVIGLMTGFFGLSTIEPAHWMGQAHASELPHMRPANCAEWIADSAFGSGRGDLPAAGSVDGTVHIYAQQSASTETLTFDFAPGSEFSYGDVGYYYGDYEYFYSPPIAADSSPLVFDLPRKTEGGFERSSKARLRVAAQQRSAHEEFDNSIPVYLVVCSQPAQDTIPGTDIPVVTPTSVPTPTVSPTATPSPSASPLAAPTLTYAFAGGQAELIAHTSPTLSGDPVVYFGRSGLTHKVYPLGTAYVGVDGTATRLKLVRAGQRLRAYAVVEGVPASVLPNPYTNDVQFMASASDLAGSPTT